MDWMGLAKVIVNASVRMERDEQPAIAFIQIGFDPKVT